MKFSSKITIDDSEIKNVFSEIQEWNRGTVKYTSKDSFFEINIDAKDVTALRALIEGAIRTIKIYEETKSLSNEITYF
jgi:tRNA threonylcarbamoyladenosine modification (KEOPS) complex  Pcc1 subunit